MSGIKLEGIKKPYHPKDSDEVRCDSHGVVTTWGALSSIQRLALESGIDTADHLPCLLAPEIVTGSVGRQGGMKL